jgi:AraC-like DNA-binding protein
MTHFSRRFKSAYGVLPSKFRSLVVVISRDMGQKDAC